MSPERNFLITIILVSLALLTSIIYILTSIEPNIFWLGGLIILVGITVTQITSIIFFAFSRLRSFETPRQMYRRQLKKAWVIGLIAILVVLAQKFFDLV